MHIYFPPMIGVILYIQCWCVVFCLTEFGNHFPMSLNILRKYFNPLLHIPLHIIELFTDFDCSRDLQGLTEIGLQGWEWRWRKGRCERGPPVMTHGENLISVFLSFPNIYMQRLEGKFRESPVISNELQTFGFGLILQNGSY